MISQVIETGLSTLSPSLVTDVFIVIIIALFSLSLYWGKQNTHSKFTGYSPTLLTSIGILGTFTGIVIGLLDFDTNNIDGSITFLLEGLKVAFVTSLLGIFASILLKVLATTRTIKVEEVKKDIGVADLYSIMNEQNDNLIKLNNKLSDNDDSSLIGQIKLMRSDASDNHKVLIQKLEPLHVLPEINEVIKTTDKTLLNIYALINRQHEDFTTFKDTLWIKLQDFADMLSKSATEQVINALKEVVQDFNNKLGEQFAENFEKLHIAVENLVLWQNEYKEQLSQMKNQFELSVTSMSTMEKSIDSISTNSKVIPESMDQLKTVIETNQHQVDELSNHLEAFKDVRDKAVEAIPEIRTQIDTTVKGFETASVELMNGVTQSTDKVSEVLVQGAQDFAENVSQTNAALVDSSDTLKITSTEIRELLDAALLDINKNVKQMIDDLANNSKEVSVEFKEIGTVLMSELNDTHQQVQTSISQTTSTLQENIDTMANKQVNHMQSVFENLETTHNQVQSNIEKVTSDLESSIENLSQEQVKQMNKVFDGVEHTINQALQKTGDAVKDQVTLMDDIAGKEIENVMQAMGTSLARISGQFTNDYQKLVSEMKSIVETRG